MKRAKVKYLDGESQTINYTAMLIEDGMIQFGAHHHTGTVEVFLILNPAVIRSIEVELPQSVAQAA